MAREAHSLTIADLSAFSRALRAELARGMEPPGHLALMNMIARAAGFGNVQHLKAAAPRPPVALAAPAVPRSLAVALRGFDAGGRMARWPAKTSVQGLCLWAIWSHLPARRTLSEAEVNRVIDGWHSFGDRALIRRSLIDHRLCSRTEDGSAYRRVEVAPTADALALLTALADRQRA